MMLHFQRQYTWTRNDWQVLLGDVLLLCIEKNNNDVMAHLVGLIVIVSNGCVDVVPPTKVLTRSAEYGTYSYSQKAFRLCPCTMRAA